MELIQLNTLNDDDLRLLFISIKKSIIKEYFELNSFRKTLYKIYSSNLFLHFVDEKNLDRFCAFANINKDTLKEKELLRKFFRLVEKSVLRILHDNPIFLINDKSLYYVAKLMYLTTSLEQEFYAASPEEKNRLDHWFVLKSEASNKTHYSIQSLSSKFFHSNFKNIINVRDDVGYPKRIVFVKDIISTILSWFKEDDAYFNTKQISDKIFEKHNKNTDDFYLKLFKYIKKFRKDKNFNIPEPTNIQFIKKKKKQHTKYDKKRSITKEDIEYLAFYYVHLSINDESTKKFTHILSYFNANKYIPNLTILHKMFFILKSSWTSPLFYSHYFLTNDNQSEIDKKVLWFFDKFNIFPTQEDVYTLKHKVFKTSNNDAYISEIRSISPLKHPHELKQISLNFLFIKHFILVENLKHTIDRVPQTIFQLNKIGIPVKTLSAYFSKFINFDIYLKSFELENQKIAALADNHTTIHNICHSLKNLASYCKKLNDIDLDSASINSLKKIFKLASSFNVDGTSIHHLNNSFAIVFEHKKLSEILHFISDKKISSLRDINTFISDFDIQCEAARMEFLINKNVLFENDKRLEFAKKELKSVQLLDFLDLLANDKKALQSFNKKTNFKTSELTIGDYTLGVYDHHHYAGFSGALARGVCIPSFGPHRHTHFNSNFLNLSLFNDDKGIVLWGLLVLAIDVYGKYWFILNNLQGSINDKKLDAAIVMENIVQLLKNLCNDNESVGGIILNNASFNAINILKFLKIDENFDFEANDLFFDEHKIKLMQKVRVDFSLNDNLYINHHSYYGDLVTLPL